MLQDKKEELVSNLNTIYALLMKILIIEEHENEALRIEDYDNFYEYIQHEGSIMNEVKSIMSGIVPDLMYHKDDPEVKSILSSIEELNEKILEKNIDFQNDVKGRIDSIKRKLTSLNNYMPSSLNVSTILNIRA
ncbi:MAG: hypothetical protein DRP84_06990 [Spirochaetes bacterium]|nr:MAG: hypothetical protein DRP84_06990 [Spirochaetota bacterium]